MEWFKMRLSWGGWIKRCSDAEAGRFLKALYAYVEQRTEYQGGGKEELLVYDALDALRDDLAAYDKAEAARKDKEKRISEARKAAAMKRWGKQTDANESKRMQTDAFAQRCSGLHEFASHQDSETKKLLDNNNNAREAGPFGLTEDDIQRTLERDQRIESAARSVGLILSEAAMIKARELCRVYGEERLLWAISRSVDAPKWAYVEAVLKGGGRNADRGNRQESHGDGGAGQKNGKYSQLFESSAV